MRLHGMLLLIVALVWLASGPATAQTYPFLGEIRYVSFNFAPQGWALCDGQLLAIKENTALFELIGTSFGGDGVNTFALPDMRGRVPVGTGQGAGLSNRVLGEQGGAEAVALTVAQMPKHRHSLKASSGVADSKAPAGDVLADSAGAAIYATHAPDVALNSGSIGATGEGQPHENMQPYLGMTCIIALQGIFPTQN